MADMKNVAVLVYPGVELVDMNGPIDTFVKANRYNGNRYRVYTVAESVWDVKSEGAAVLMTPQYTLCNCPPPDIIVIPAQIDNSGAYGSGSVALVNWLIAQSKRNSVTVMSVCVGAYILANTGLLNGKKATTHYAAISGIQAKYPAIDFIKNVRFQADGNFITTGGVTSGIDGALYMVSVSDGADIAQKVADIMVYNRDAPLPPNTILP